MNIRDELEATQARLAELKQLKARGFDLPQVQAQQRLSVLEAQAQVEALRTQVTEAEQAVETSRLQLVRAMEGHALDPRKLSPLERRLLMRVDGGRLVGGFLGLLTATTALGLFQWVHLPVRWALPVALAVAAYNGWKVGRSARAPKPLAATEAVEAPVDDAARAKELTRSH